jgi:mannose-6-phosphate isomerase
MTAFSLRPLPIDRLWGGRRVARRFGWDDSRSRGEWWLASVQPGQVSPLEEGRADATRGAADLAAWFASPDRAPQLAARERFPLLVKFLDCEQLLSLQVHPDDAVAREQGLPNGKTEAWVVLEAAPGACVYLGTAQGVSAARLLDRVEAGASDGELRTLLRRVAVASGDALLVPAGTVHAIGAGLVLYEIQQDSDTTWRIHDWGRGRPVQLAEARQAVRDLPPPRVVRRTARSGWETLLSCPAFTLRSGRVEDRLALDVPGRFALLTILAGHGRLLPAGGEQGPPLLLAPGATVFAPGPAALEGAGLELLVADPPR